MILNQITYKEISRLGDVELSTLLLRLLLLESEKQKFEGVEKIVVPLRINVGDAGEDGRVKCSDTKSSKWVKNKYSLYQCKATDLKPKGYYDEFFKQDNKKNKILKEQIEGVLDNGGQYVFFTSKDYNETSTKTRVAKVNEAIDYANHQLGKKYTYDQVRILEANEISIWVNEFISAVTLVKEFCNIQSPFGLRTWGQWNETSKCENRLVYSPGTELKSFSESIIEMISNEKVVRVIGHSGIGKSRFIMETFSPDSENGKVFSNMLVYIDLAFFGKDVISFIIDHINYNGLIILDNCNESIHNSISGMIKSTGNLKLISIDHSVETSESIFFKIDKKLQTETVELIIKNKYSGKIPDWVVDKLIELADGYPKMADYICGSVDRDGHENINLTLPKEEILNNFIKKLIFGHNQFDKEQYTIIKACSIFKEFGFIDHSIEEIAPTEEQERAQKQIETICNIACVPISSSSVFYSTILDFKNRREIIERKGYNYYVKPEPLASNLAADWLLSFNLSDAKTFAEKLNDVGLLEQFCLRLQSLDQIPRAKTVVQKLWGEGSPFSSAEVLNTEMGSRLFRSVVEVNPEITVKSLRSFVEKYSIEQVKEIKKGRRYLVWAIEKLLYREEAFSNAAKTLFDFSVGENESIGNNSTNQFLQLFHIYLSGTVVGYNERIDILKYGLSKKSKDYDRLIILALGSALKGEGFHRMGGAERQGANKIFTDYQPKNWQEVYDYWEYAIETLTEFALRNDDLRELAMEQIANSIRIMFSHNQVDLITDAIKKIYSATLIYWEGAIRGLNWTLKYAELYDERNNIVKDLLKFITPNDIENQFKMFVSKPEWEHENDEKGDYIDISANKVAEFVIELHRKDIEIKKYFKYIVQGEQRQGFNFGVNISKVYGNQLELGKSLIEELRKVKKENQNSDALGGLIYDSSVDIKNALLNEVLQDPLIYFHTFYLMRVSNPTKEDIFKLFPIVRKEPSYIVYFNNFIYGRALDKLSTDDVIDFCNEIAKYDLQGKWVSIAIISQYCHNSQELWNKCKSFIKQLIISDNFLNGIDKVRIMDEYHWSNSIIKILKEEKDEPFAKEISKQILEAFAGVRISSVDVYLKNLCLELVAEYFEIFWNVISTGILGAAYLNIKFTLGSHNGSWGERGLLFKGNNVLIFEWCKLNRPKGALRIAYMMPIYENQEGKSLWHPFALKMINEFGSDEGFLRELSANMGSFSAVGSSIGYYEMQIELIKELVNHRNLTVREWAKERLKTLNRIILRERIDEESDR